MLLSEHFNALKDCIDRPHLWKQAVESHLCLPGEQTSVLGSVRRAAAPRPLRSAARLPSTCRQLGLQEFRVYGC